MKSVASRSSVSARRRIAAGCVVSSTWKRLGAERALDHLGREARAAHPEQDEGVDLPGRGELLDEALQVAEPAAHPHRLVQPAEPLRLVVAGPERRVALPDPLDELGGRDGAHAASRRNGSTSSSNSRGRSMLGTCAVAGDRRRARARDLALEPLGDRVHVGPVLVADEDQRRHLRSRRAARRSPRRAALPRLLAHRHAGARARAAASRRRVRRTAGSTSSGCAAARRPTCAGSPRPPRRGRRASSAASSSPQAPASPATTRGRAGPAPTSTSARDELRARERDLERDAAAERHADERGRARARARSSMLDQVAGVREACPARAASGRSRAGRAGATRKRLRVPLPLRIPHAAVADPLVDEHERGPFAGDLRVDRHAQRLRPRRARRAWPGCRRAAP